LESSELGLREQKKAMARANALDVAHVLFREKGFDQTTLEDICAESGISKRTFFRYFKDKESLVFPNRDTRLEAFRGFLQMYGDADNPFEVLRVATKVFSTEYNSNSDKILAQQVLINSSGALRARESEIDRDWELEIAAAFGRRSAPGRPNELWAAVAAGAVMGVVRATMRQWFAHGCLEDLNELGQMAIDSLERGFPERLVPAVSGEQSAVSSEQ